MTDITQTMDQPTDKVRTTTLGYRFSQWLGRSSMYLILILGSVVAIIPFIWMLSTSFMTLGESVSGRLVTRQGLLHSFNYTEAELDTPLNEVVPDFVRETDRLDSRELKLTVYEIAEFLQMLKTAGIRTGIQQ